MTNEISSLLNDELYFFFLWRVHLKHSTPSFFEKIFAYSAFRFTVLPEFFFACGELPTSTCPNIRLIIMCPKKCLRIYWHAFKPSTRFCAHCHVLIPTVMQVVVPTDTPLCQITRHHARWHALVPTDAHLRPLTRLYHWDAFVPTFIPSLPS